MASISALQRNSGTFLGRYWTEHSVLRRYVPSDVDLKVLSFGCSTGEELVTLQGLFPSARLFGCDTDWTNLARARALLKGSATIFDSAGDEIGRHGPYDVIVCNSVLLQATRTSGQRKLGIDPSDWLNAVATLDSVLNPCGILQIINSNIPFRFHPAASDYVALRSPLILGPSYVDQFDLDGRHLCSGVPGTGHSSLLNRHLGEADWRLLVPTDLEDVHFRKAGPQRPLSAVDDEIIPNLAAKTAVASGTTAYRPHIGNDPRPSSHTEVEVHWTAFRTGEVRLQRQAKRIWFDGAVAGTGTTTVDLTGPSAAAFIESAVGRRSTRISMEYLFASPAIQSALI